MSDNRPLIEALNGIAGNQQCADNLMSNQDVARAAQFPTALQGIPQ